MVETVEVEIGEKLAGEVADGDGPITGKGCKEVVPLEIARLAVVGARCNNFIDQPQRLFTFDLSSDGSR